jgi:hypothetical protein
VGRQTLGLAETILRTPGAIFDAFASGGESHTDVSPQYISTEEEDDVDLRLARYFPGQAYVGEFWIEPGEHEVRVEFYDAGGKLLRSETRSRRNYAQEKLNLVTAYDLE